MEHEWINPQEIVIDFDSEFDLEQSSQGDWLNPSNANVNGFIGDAALFKSSHISTNQGPEEVLLESSDQNDSTLVVCYGSVCGVQLRLRKRLTISLTTLLETGEVTTDAGFAVLQCHLTDHSCAIVVGVQTIADTNKKTFQTLTSCSRFSPLRFEAIIPIQTIHLMAECRDPEQLFVVDINISGPPSKADHIAADLCHQGTFLQDPLWLQEAIPYKNPQSLDLPALSLDEPYAPPITRPNGNNEAQPAEDILEEELVEDFNHILDASTRGDYLDDKVEIPQICTHLLSHQVEGLKFIVQRESHTSPLSLNLWADFGTVDGQHYFEHRITKSRSPTMVNTTGGIIADDMGLGKTLTMLTAIMGSRKVAAERARVMFVPEKLPVAAMSTLVVVPSALLMENWTEEIQKHMINNSMRYYKYHGPGKNIDLYQLLMGYDVVLTTYGTLATAHKRKDSLLHQISWYRVVLDEAHTIRNSSTKQFEAVRTLHALHRWCLTGTPIQNSLEDLGALIRFLRVPILEEPSKFRRHIINKTHLNKSINDKDFANLKALLGSICLRRNRSLLTIAEPDTKIYRLNFSEDEEAQYKHILFTCQHALDLAVSGHKGKEAHQSVLETLLRLRLFCNHGTIFRTDVHPNTRLPTDPEEALSYLESTEQATCYYCASEVSSLRAPHDTFSAILTMCRHVICSECLSQDRQASDGTCMLCQRKHTRESATTSSDMSDHLHPERLYPTKLLALCEDIQMHRIKGKSVVFSFWKKSLDIVNYLLQSRGIHVVRIDGSVSLRERTKILAEFQQSQGGIVLLMTLGTGSEGLNNLSTADTVHVLEPQWNPSVEKQAIGRVVRLGQTKKVTIVQYIMEKTVENSIQKQQFRKLRLFHSGFSNKNSKEAKQNSDAIRRLMFAGYET